VNVARRILAAVGQALAKVSAVLGAVGLAAAVGFFFEGAVVRGLISLGAALALLAFAILVLERPKHRRRLQDAMFHDDLIGYRNEALRRDRGPWSI
jgi:hypothetical protein